MEERENTERNDIKCILNSKHRPHYGISTFRMHKPREKDEKSAEVERGSGENSGSRFLYGHGLPTSYYKHYLIFCAVIIEHVILLYIMIIYSHRFSCIMLIMKKSEIFS